jgi:hypothetical protein
METRDTCREVMANNQDIIIKKREEFILKDVAIVVDRI